MEKTSANIFMKYPALHHFASNNTGCYHFIIQFFYISKYIHFLFTLFKNLIQSFNYLIIIDMIFHIITLFKLFSFKQYIPHTQYSFNKNREKQPFVSIFLNSVTLGKKELLSEKDKQSSCFILLTRDPKLLLVFTQ